MDGHASSSDSDDSDWCKLDTGQKNNAYSYRLVFRYLSSVIVN
jgi:hypothetical protein